MLHTSRKNHFQKAILSLFNRGEYVATMSPGMRQIEERYVPGIFGSWNVSLPRIYCERS